MTNPIAVSETVITGTINPLLAKVRMPGRVFKLPSQGLFYTNDELSPDVKNGEVEVYPLTAMDEIVLATPDKLLSGKAITEVFLRCIPQVKRPMELLARDVDFLMVCLRIVTFGDVMEVLWQHSCEDSKQRDYEVNLSEIMGNTKSMDPTKLADEYKVVLENGQTVLMRPMKQGNLVDLMQTAAFTKTGQLDQQEAEKLIVDAMTNVIISVDGVDDRDNIRQWVASISLGWKRKIEKSMQQVTQWGSDFETQQFCKDCGEPITVSISPNPFNFFT